MSDGTRKGLDDDMQLAIADVTEIPLDVLLSWPESALGDSLRRLIEQIDTPSEHYAAHSNAL